MESTFGGIKGKAGVLEMSEGRDPIFMGKWCLIDDLFGKTRFFIEDVKNEV